LTAAALTLSGPSAHVDLFELLLEIKRVVQNLLARSVEVARVVDEHVDRAAVRFDFLHGRVDRRRVGNVHSVVHVVLSDQLQQLLGRGAAHDQYGGAHRHELLGDGQTQTAVTSRDHHATTGKLLAVVHAVDVQVASVVFLFGASETRGLVGHGVRAAASLVESLRVGRHSGGSSHGPSEGSGGCY